MTKYTKWGTRTLWLKSLIIQLYKKARVCSHDNIHTWSPLISPLQQSKENHHWHLLFVSTLTDRVIQLFLIQIFSDCNTEKFNQLFFWLSSVAFEIVCQLIHGLGQYQGSTRVKFRLWWLQWTQANGDECWHHTYIAFLLGHFSNRKIQLQWTDFNQYWAEFIIFLLYIFITQ